MVTAFRSLKCTMCDMHIWAQKVAQNETSQAEEGIEEAQELCIYLNDPVH